MRNFLICIFLCCSILLISQNKYEIKGKVIDFHDGTPLNDAEISLQFFGKELKTLTDNNGNFLLLSVPKGNYKLVVNHHDCETLLVTVEVPIKKELIIRLEHHQEHLSEVQVIASKDLNKTSIQKKIEVEKIEQHQSENLTKALQEINGVQAINTGNSISKPVVDGVHSSRLPIINQGVRQQDADWGIEHAPMINLNAVEKLSVLKGASVLQYATDAIGGIVVVEKYKSDKKDTLISSVQTNFQTNNRAFGISAQTHKAFNNSLNVLFDVAYQKSGDFSTPNYVLSNTGTQQKATSILIAKKNYKSGFEAYYSFVENQLGILRASHIGNLSDLIQAIEQKKPWYVDDFTYDINNPKQHIFHHLGKISAFFRFAELGKLDIQYAYQNNRRQEFDVRRVGRNDVPAVDLLLHSHQFTSDFTFDSKEFRKIKTGIFASYFDNSTALDTGTRPIVPNYQSYNLGLYGFISHKLSSNSFIEASSRVDYTSINAQKFYNLNFWNSRNYNKDFGNEVVNVDVDRSRIEVHPTKKFLNFSNVLGISFQKNKHQKTTFNVSYLMRNPNVNELFSEGLHHSAAQIERGDLRLKPEKSLKLNTEIQKKWKNFNDFQTNFEVYFNYISDFIYGKPSDFETTIRGSFPIIEYQQVDAILSGISTDVSYNFQQDFTISNKFSYQIGENQTEKIPLFIVSPWQTTTSLQWKPNFIKDFYLKIQHQFVSEQNRFPNYNQEITYFQNNQQITKNVDISSPPNSYHLINVEINKKIQWKNQKLSAGIFIENALNTSYRNYINRLRFFEDEVGRNIKFQIKYQF